jgi:hypothetical protein
LGQNLHAGEFDDALLARIESVVSPGTEIKTLSANRPNVIAATGRDGVWVHTLRSDSLHTGPQLVPAWMIVTAWRRLQKQGLLSHKELLEDLNVKRSAFVVALLAQFPDVTVRSTRPVVIECVRND